MRAWLLVSVLVNLFAFGVIAGGLAVFWRHGTIPLGEPGQVRAPTRPLFDAAAALPPEDRQRFFEALRQAAVAGRPLRRDAAQARREAALLFAAPQFDAAAVSALLQRSRDDDMALRARLEAAAIDVAATLPAAERAPLAEALARGGPLRHPRRP